MTRSLEEPLGVSREGARHQVGSYSCSLDALCVAVRVHGKVERRIPGRRPTLGRVSFRFAEAVKLVAQ